MHVVSDGSSERASIGEIAENVNAGSHKTQCTTVMVGEEETFSILGRCLYFGYVNFLRGSILKP